MAQISYPFIVNMMGYSKAAASGVKMTQSGMETTIFKSFEYVDLDLDMWLVSSLFLHDVYIVYEYFWYWYGEDMSRRRLLKSIFVEWRGCSRYSRGSFCINDSMKKLDAFSFSVSH